MIETVLKIGGSLLQKNQLTRLCENLSRIGAKHAILIIPGGGPFADTVRNCQKPYKLSEDAVHWMAILAMDQYGHFLCDLIPGSQKVQSLPEAQKISLSGRVPILLPYEILYRTDPLPHSWSVTSDTISAWIAQKIRAQMLVLLKSMDGIPVCPPSRAEGKNFLEKISIKELAPCEAVDSYLPKILKTSPQLNLWIINGRQPERVAEFFNQGRTIGTQLIRSVP